MTSDVQDAWEVDPDWAKDLPKPLYWRVLIMCRKPKKESKGGIALPSQVQDNEGILDYVGKIVAVGKLAHTHARLQGEIIPQIGEFVMFGRYAGQQIFYRGVRFLVVNDDEILGIVPNPDALRIYV